MSLRVPDANAMPPEGAGDGSQAPLSSPFSAGSGGFLTAADLESKQSRFSGALVLLLVVAAAGGVLFGMRRMGMGRSRSVRGPRL